MPRFLASLLAAWLTVLWGSGTFVAAICECAHGPEIACECPHHLGSAEDAELPPCHRAAMGKKPAAPAEGERDTSAFKNKCGASPAELIPLPPAVVLRASLEVPPPPLQQQLSRWRPLVTAPRDPLSDLEPPPPRQA